MSQTATNLCKVVIQGLQKVEDVERDDGWSATIGDDFGLYDLSLNLREDELMWPGLWQNIQACGFGMPHKLVHGEVEYEPFVPLTVVREHDEVLVVSDDQASTPTTIKMDETLISHTNTHHVPPLEFHSHLERAVRDQYSFCVSFERTTRIPDDNKLHHLPPSLGRYQLFSVEKYSQHLPKTVTETGGVFFSMWQREAMWINFQPTSRKYAVRVFVGRVNAITGKEMQDEQDTTNITKLQDYVVIPGQSWLDGICIAPGVVRQFVAMPLGSGYTVEGQKTSEEKHGGLQIEVTPQMEHGKRVWAWAEQQHITYPANDPIKYGGLSEFRTPRQLGCEVGDILKSYPTHKEFKQPFRIQDLFAPRAKQKERGDASQEDGSLPVATITLKAAGGMFSLPPAPPRAGKLRERRDMPSFQSLGSNINAAPVQLRHNSIKELLVQHDGGDLIIPNSIESQKYNESVPLPNPPYFPSMATPPPQGWSSAPAPAPAQGASSSARPVQGARCAPLQRPKRSTQQEQPPPPSSSSSGAPLQPAPIPQAPFSALPVPGTHYAPAYYSSGNYPIQQAPLQGASPQVPSAAPPRKLPKIERKKGTAISVGYGCESAPPTEDDGTERQTLEMLGDVPVPQEAEERQLSEKESTVKRENIYNGVDPELLQDKDKTDLMELTEAQAKSVKTLGLAAGGKLIQDIYKDPFPTTIWNHAGARILHVHMIDPESCERVTHVVPQPPPMAVEDYVKSGGQFFVVEEKIDERLDGGDFDNVKSVSQMDQHLGITTEPEFDPKKPKMCTTCERRLCDCIIRPCNHQFCNVCIKRLDEAGDTEQSVQQARHWKCPTCNSPVSHVAGFSAPMNLPGEERLLRTKVPVHVLKIEDGRLRLSSMQTSRV